MPNALGIKGIMGLGKESSFRTAIDATDRLLMLSEGINFDYSDALHEYLHGGAGIPGMERLFEPVGGSFECIVPYTKKSGSQFVSASSLIALAMGTTTWDAAQGSNRITPLDDLNVFGTFAWNKWRTDHVWELISTYIKSFTLTISADSPMTLSAELLGYDLKIGATTQNQVSELQSLPTDVPNLILLRHFTFRIGDQADALGASDEIGISSFTLNYNNNLTEAEQSTPDNSSSHTDPLNTIQPVRNGFREVTLEIVVPRYENDTFFDHVANEDNLQCTFLSSQPSTSDKFDIIFPNLQISQAPDAPIAGAEALSQTITFRALKRNSASDVKFSDNSTNDGEVWIETKDERTGLIF